VRSWHHTLERELFGGRTAVWLRVELRLLPGMIAAYEYAYLRRLAIEWTEVRGGFR
jgi:hypothetical protein